jgi:hypothetical protein
MVILARLALAEGGSQISLKTILGIDEVAELKSRLKNTHF